MTRALKVFVSYSHKDESLKLELDEHLSSLRQSRAISDWHDREILAGAEWEKELDENLNAADIILLLISASFINSDYCWGVELKRALERHETGSACVIPIILRPALWQNTPIAKLQAFPKDAKPITTWNNRDEAFLDVVVAIQKMVDRWGETTSAQASVQDEEHYRNEVLFCLRQDSGKISEISRVILNSLRESLNLPLHKANEIEAEVVRPFQIFQKALLDLKGQALTEQLREQLGRLQRSLNLEDSDVAILFANLFPTPIFAPFSELSLPKFSFQVITVNHHGQELDRRSAQAHYFSEELTKNVVLDMVAIPGGMFWMGGEVDAQAYEKPRHQVTIAPFFMGKYAVTQAQWKAIAKLPRIHRDLKSYPANFKSGDRPVESVSWEDAIEFCDRLSQKTGKSYRLPSEAEWEYACRAGTATAFHFGETITQGLVNHREHETCYVGSFPPNAFGLYEMHGNVWEWCADAWHENYENAPVNGEVWQTSSAFRVLRGGSWSDFARDCRSAARSKDRIENRFIWRGFRVALSSSNV